MIYLWDSYTLLNKNRMASYNGYDAFWAQRIKKEVITQMRHQEDYEIVTKKKLGKFY